MSTWDDLEDMLYRAVTGGRAPREGFHDAVAELRRQVPSTAELARRLGIPRRTVGDWLNRGANPKPEHRRTVLEALRRHRLRLRREDQVRAGNVRVVAVQRYTDDNRTDNTRVWQHPRAGSPYNIGWDPRANGAIVDRYLAGDMRGAAEAFIAGIRDPDYQDMTTPQNDADEVHFDIDSIKLT